MYIFNKANSYFTYRSFKSKIQNVEFQFGSVVTIHTMSCWCPSKAITPGHAKDTHTHTRTHMRFGKTPLPSAAPGITSVQSKAVPRTQHLQQGDHTNSFTQSHSPWRCDYKMSCSIEKNRLGSENVAVPRSPALGHQGLTSVRGEVFGEALWKQEYFSIIELEIQGTVDTLRKENRKLSYKENSHKQLGQITAHTGTANRDKSHAGSVQSTCLKKSMYKTVLCKHGEVNVRNPRWKDHKYRQQRHPRTAQKTTPEAWKQPGNTVLKIQMAGLRHPRGPLSLVCIHTYTYIYFSFWYF